ncbi:MAG: deoxyribose-phosphate aldolase [Anaerorhabdus sp.]
MNVNELTPKTLAKCFDHTFLKAYATQEDMKKLCEEAKELGCAMVAIDSFPVSTCKTYLKDCDVHVGAAISFPLGQTTIATKVYETKEAIRDGADEIDYVLNIGKVKEKDFAYIKEEMQAIVSICKEANVLSKVIFENCYLEKDEIVACAKIAKEVKPDFIKTSTGFGTSGATFEDVALMVQSVDGACQVKAAGGIRDWETCKKMLELGATRIGTSSSYTILEGFCKERNA